MSPYLHSALGHLGTPEGPGLLTGSLAECGLIFLIFLEKPGIPLVTSDFPV